MNPAPSPSNPPRTPRPKLVVSGVNRRDIIIGIVIAVVILGFILLAVLSTGGYKERNKLSGVIRARNEPGLRETQTTVGLERTPRKPVTEKTIDTGYSVRVWVESEKSEREVMVSKEDWEKAKVGDTLEFLRPPSEQR
jgi:hypothetical protein